MKNVLVSILAFLYLTTSTGATVQLHYCMDKLIGWDLSGDQQHKCEGCGMKLSKSSKKGCCKHELKLLKSASDQRLAELSVDLFQAPSVAASTLYFELPVISFSTVAERHPVSHAPPPAGTSLYLRNCVFRI